MLDNRKSENGEELEADKTDNNCNGKHPEDKENQQPENNNSNNTQQTDRSSGENKQVVKKEEETKSGWPKYEELSLLLIKILQFLYVGLKNP